MASEKNILKLMCYSRNTLYVWKREKRPIVELIENYFTDNEIEEFIATGKIDKFDKLKEMDFEKDKILNKFFFEYYTRKRINRKFAKEIFPKFEEYIDNLNEKINSDFEKVGKKINSSKFGFLNKSYFIDFVLQSDLDNRSSIILTITKLNEVEFFIIMTNYRLFLEKQTF